MMNLIRTYINMIDIQGFLLRMFLICALAVPLCSTAENSRVKRARNPVLVQLFIPVPFEDSYETESLTKELSAVEELSIEELASEIWTLCSRPLISTKENKIVQRGKFFWESLENRTNIFEYNADNVIWLGYQQGRPLRAEANKKLFQMPTFAPYPEDPENYISVTVNSYTISNARFEILRRGQAIVNDTDTIPEVLFTKGVFLNLNISGKDTLYRSEEYRWYVPYSYIPIAIQTEGKLYVQKNIDREELKNQEKEFNQKQHLIDVIKNTKLTPVSQDDESKHLFSIEMEEAIPVDMYVKDKHGNIFIHRWCSSTSYSLDLSALPDNFYSLTIQCNEIPDHPWLMEIKLGDPEETESSSQSYEILREYYYE